MKSPGRQKTQPRKSNQTRFKRNIKWKHADWKHAFAPIQRRILLKHMLWYLSAGILCSLGVALLLFGLSFLMPMEHLWAACLVCGMITAAIVLIIGWFRRPSAYEAARMTDRLGFQEKVLTACELDERDDEMANLQRKDAIECLHRFDKKHISLRIPKYHGYILILMTAALVMFSLIPNPMDRLIQQKKELKAEIQEQLEELKETEEKLSAEETLTEEQRQELAELVEELADKLKKTADYKEALKEISKAEEELTALIDKIREESIGKLASQLGELEETQALAQALSDRNLSNLETELEQLKAQLEQGVDKEELAEKLKETLEKVAESMAEGDIKNRLAAASKSLSSGQTRAAAGQLGEALSQAVYASNSMGDAKYALQQMRSSIAQAAGEAQYAQNAGNQAGQNTNNANPNSGNQNNGNSGNGNSGQGGNSSGQNSEGTESGEGQGEGTGQGQGNSGQSGSGIGTGTTNQSSGQGGSGTTGNQNSNSHMGQENAQTVYEQIYAPERLGDGGEITHVPGQQTGDGDITREEDGRGIGDLSGFIPYQDVYQEYRNEAMNSMDRRVLPPNIQEMVREYFDALGQ